MPNKALCIQLQVVTEGRYLFKKYGHNLAYISRNVFIFSAVFFLDSL